MTFWLTREAPYIIKLEFGGQEKRQHLDLEDGLAGLEVHHQILLLPGLIFDDSTQVYGGHHRQTCLTEKN